METPHLRPVFSKELAAEPDVVMGRVRSRLSEPKRKEWGMVGGRSMDLYVQPAEEHFWSPHLTVQVEEAEAGSRLHGRFAPKPSVWTLFVFLYSVAAFGGMLGGAYGFAQWAMEVRPWALWSVPVAVLAVGGLYWASSVGQRLGAAQMAELRGRLDELVSPE